MISYSGHSIKLIVKVILTGLKSILTTGYGGWAPRASSPQTTSIPPLCLGNRSIPQTLLGNMSALCTLQIVPCNIFHFPPFKHPAGSVLLLPAAQHASLIHKVPRVSHTTPGNADTSLAFKARFYYLRMSEMPLVTKQNPFVGFWDQNSFPILPLFGFNLEIKELEGLDFVFIYWLLAHLGHPLVPYGRRRNKFLNSCLKIIKRIL